MTAEDRLKALGLQLPAAPAAVAAYRPWSRVGNLVITAGQLPFRDGTLAYAGRLGEQMSVEDGQQAARLCALNA
ncbi:MAG: RidA family protein, partial [bacterium]